MPRRIIKKSYGRRRRVRRRVMGRGTRRVPRPIPTGIVDVYQCKLKYASSFLLTCATLGTSSTYVWRMNSLFDPDFTGGGHQPYMFDQISSLYTYYNVTSCSVLLQMTPVTTSQDIIQIATRFNAQVDAAPPTAYEYLNELSRTKLTSLSPGTQKRVKGVANIAKLLGVGSKIYRTDFDYLTLVGANPVASLTPSFSLTYASVTANQPMFLCEARFTYTCTFRKRIFKAQS